MDHDAGGQDAVFTILVDGTDWSRLHARGANDCNR
jgi:hypothetical protein